MNDGNVRKHHAHLWSFLLFYPHTLRTLRSMTSRARSAGYKAARRISKLLAMVFGSGSSNGYKSGPSTLLTRSRGLTAIIAVGLCSIIYLTWFLPAFSVKTKLGRLFPTVSGDVESQTHLNSTPRRLIVFGDSWSDNGRYPIDPPSKDQIPTREEAQGKVWTEWLCSAASGHQSTHLIVID